MKNNIEITENKQLDETVIKKTISNGLEVFICKKKGFIKKIGMFGTRYGSIHNDFIDIKTNKRVSVPDGIAHFLEHKLFEQEDSNALDLFSKEGISSNAYTSFDHTVYFFETIDKFELALEMLIKLVKTPYFTDENVEKEKGIIAQEISMYEDDPNFTVYFNTLRAMYVNNPVKIDIAGTIESISNINKDILSTCYNTFYNPNNMFMVIIGDVNEEEVLNQIEKNMKLYETNKISEEVIKFNVEEPSNIFKKRIEKDMGLYMPQISIGYKLEPVEKEEIIKKEEIADIISKMYFSKKSNFFQEMYERGIVSDDIDFIYEGTKDFSHIIISSSSTKIDEFEWEIFEYINKIKEEKIDEDLFENTKRSKIGQNVISSENPNNSYRRIIDSILNESKLFYDVEVLSDITSKDVKDFLKEIDYTKAVISIVK